LLDAHGVADPHARYNSLVRELVGYDQALEREQSRRRRLGRKTSAPVD